MDGSDDVSRRGKGVNSFHIEQAKMASRECDQHMGPCMLCDDSDWSENGEIKRKKQMQYEYWEIIYYSLLISITAFLITHNWKDKSSALPAGTEVTVEPSEREVTTDVVEGSYYAIIERGSTEVGEAVEYVVKPPGGASVTVRRSLLRERKWHRMAFLQFTLEKKHDAFTTQAFFDRRHKFFQIWCDRGREAALEFARNDRAEAKRAEEQAALDAKIDAITDDAAAAAAELSPQEALEKARVVAAALAAATAARSSSAIPVPRQARRRAPTDAAFTEWMLHLDDEKFWAWVGHSDNATHFKSKENLYYWSQRIDKVAFLRMVWIEFGCPGHGKGPWDGIGAMVKTKITRDITNEQCLTPSGTIKTPLCVAQHARATFCTEESPPP